jgi:hypothetical protein
MYMVAFVLAAALAMAGPQAGQQPTQTPSPAPAPAAQNAPAEPLKPEDLPVSIERIQRALAAPKPIELKEQHPVFRLEIFGKKPTIEEILGEKFWVGPVPYGGMTHQDFMNMVTPKELQPYGGFSGGYLLSEVGLTLAEQWVLKQAIQKFHDAKQEHEREAARKEVMEALAALEKARRDAGLPDK